ncbi:MAG: hypothetical protein OIF38_06685, partial [Cellvibrionaceae bacterium]|nr:hypothetical protein [Cellvibrionaceae bacterium]
MASYVYIDSLKQLPDNAEHLLKAWADRAAARLSAPFPLWQSGASCRALRLDQIDPLNNGNKPFKQAAYMALAQSYPRHCLLSFGGAYSNHIHALAAAANIAQRKSIGVIRGRYVGEAERLATNPTLQDALGLGMKLHFVDKHSYQRRAQTDFWAELSEQFGPLFIVPEGGGGLLGAWGAQAIADGAAAAAASTIVLAVGTGATLAGLVAGLAKAQAAVHVVGVPVIALDNAAQSPLRLETENLIDGLLPETMARPQYGERSSGLKPEASVSWELKPGYAFGGYGKCPPQLQQFISASYATNQVPLEPVYTAKA